MTETSGAHDDATLATYTVGRYLAEMARLRPSEPFLSMDGRTLSYSDVSERSARLATGFARLGLAAGDRVTTFLPNSLEWVLSAFALARLGVVNVLANPRYRPAELAWLVGNSGSRAVLVGSQPLGEDFSEALAGVRAELAARGDAPQPELEWIVSPEDRPGEEALDWAELASAPKDPGLPERFPARPEDVLYIIYTSGTTGRPKGSMTRHGAALRNAFNSGERQGFSASDKLLCYLPLAHCFGAVNALLNTLTHGSSLVLRDEFDPATVLKIVGEERITAVYGVPTHFIMLLEALGAAGGGYDTESLVRGCIGGGEVSPELAAGIEEDLGIRHLTHAYGMTESTAIISQSDSRWPLQERLHTAGVPLPGVEVRLVDDTGADVGPDEPGDILIRGFNVHAGYFNLDPDPGARDSGWWATGDIGIRDDAGRIRILGRSKDMYKTSGFNVYPVEIENLLLTHPGIADVAVVGVPHPRKLEAGAAFVVVQPGADVTAEEVRAYVRDGLAGYKAPDHVFFVDEFPRSAATLKVQKHELRTTARNQIEDEQTEHLPDSP